MFMVRVPATIANMGPGFDSFGMAVSLHNHFSFQQAEQDSLSFSLQSTVDLGTLQSAQAKDNIVFKAMQRLFDKSGKVRPALSLIVDADIPVARGLGSSSTAIIAGLVAANQLLDNCYSNDALLKIAIELEGHPDNVAPALLGGVILYDEQPYALPWPEHWRILTLSPEASILTADAREILPQSVPLEDCIFNLRKASTLTYALLRGDENALRASLHDRLHQPYRRRLIREYEPIESLVMAEGAYGIVISGSGSTMAVFYPGVLHTSLLEKLKQRMTDEAWSIRMNDLTVDRDGAVLLSGGNLRV